MTGPVEAATRILLSTSTATSGGPRMCSYDTAPEGTAMRLGTDATYNRPLERRPRRGYIYASALGVGRRRALRQRDARDGGPPTATSSRARWWRTIRSSTGRRKTLITPGTARLSILGEGRGSRRSCWTPIGTRWLPRRWCYSTATRSNRLSLGAHDEWNGGYLSTTADLRPSDVRRTIKRPTAVGSRAAGRATSRGSPTTAPTYKPTSALTTSGDSAKAVHVASRRPRSIDAAAATAHARLNDRSTASFGLRVGTAEGDLVIIAASIRCQPRAQSTGGISSLLSHVRRPEPRRGRRWLLLRRRQSCRRL